MKNLNSIRFSKRPQGKRVVVMPAFNAASTLEATYRDIPPFIIDDVILVDHCSSDNTVELAERLGLKVTTHDANRGYVANQKTCYDAALAEGADIISCGALLSKMLKFLHHPSSDGEGNRFTSEIKFLGRTIVL